MRGKVIRHTHAQDGFRITPAYAGKRFCQRRNYMLLGDHPRLCGEKLKTAVKDGVYTGSPPPMRGKAFQLFEKE